MGRRSQVVEGGNADLPSAVFLDRDGVLNVYLPGAYARTPEELTLLPGTAEAVRKLNDAQIPVFIISNQQGVGKGIMTGADLQAVDQAMREALQAQAGAIAGPSYYCTHLSADKCDCRKPGPGLILQAAQQHGIDLAQAVFVGDTETDAQAAYSAGVGKFVFVLTGKYAGNAAIAEDRARFPVPPSHVAPDLARAVDWILRPTQTATAP